MKCVMCKEGNYQSGIASIMFEKGEMVVVFKGVPAEICDVCGDKTFSSEITDELLKRMNRISKEGITSVVLKYAA